MKAPLLRKVLILLFITPAALAAAPTASNAIITFKEQTSKIALGMNEKVVATLLGKPNEIVSPKNHSELRKLKASNGLVYWHPEFATTHFFIGLKDGIVTTTEMCTSTGSRIQVLNCSTAVEYWKGQGL